MWARVARWLAALGLAEEDLRCGPQVPEDAPERHRLRAAGEPPCQLHNNCSGKHTGFLTLNQRLAGGPDYVAIDHPVQQAVHAAFEEITGETSPAWGIDGCSAPNFACTVTGLATAAARMGAPEAGGLGTVRAEAARRLTEAMLAHPLLVAGEGRACSELMAATGGRVAIKTGAEGVFVAILPDRGLGVALKIEDGATRGAECAIAALLVRLGALAADHPLAARRLTPPILSRRGLPAGALRPDPAFFAEGRPI